MSNPEKKQWSNVIEAQHPLILHKLSILRNKATDKKTFKELVDEITSLLVYEATQDLPLTTRMIETPLQAYDAPTLAADKKPVILPILRAGIGMVDGFLSLMPNARVGHIGIFRDEESLKPQPYYFKIPDNSEKRHFFVCDPMIATGGSMLYTLEMLRSKGIENITVVSLLITPEAADKLQKEFPNIPVFTASIDDGLNEAGYILPGLGDAGDRIFGTA